MKPEELRYTKDHEWASAPKDGMSKVGISHHAQSELGDIVYIELGDCRAVSQGEACSTVESVKAASDIYAPLAGVISTFNQALGDEPGLVNEDPYGRGWLFEIKVADPKAFDELMTYDQYQEYLASK